MLLARKVVVASFQVLLADPTRLCLAPDRPART